MVSKKTFFLTLSGENINLSKFEIISLFKSKNTKFFNVKLIDRLLIISSEKNISNYIASRAALTHDISELLMVSSIEEHDIIESLKRIDLNKKIENKKSFAVRIQKIGLKDINSEYFERIIGRIIFNKIKKKIRVDLLNPDILFYGVFVKNKFVFGINNAQKIRSNFKPNSLKSRPFFHPSALNPLLARVMVNLSQIKETDIFLDPFCGTGSILIEAFLVGCNKLIGIDINHKMISGAKRNLIKIGVKNMELLLSDSNHIPLRSVSGIATDPPYGRSSSTYKKPLILLIENFFLEMSDLILKNQLITLALPSHIKLVELIDNLYFEIINEFNQYIHSSLTRRIYVIQKK
ncbi:MAG: methyltransferase domain-containing protein [Candidatus Helarchaeota archaeon]|nr:methyltransferase domain-containing protein [Candidatus Helarchaeota archaeon]